MGAVSTEASNYTTTSDEQVWIAFQDGDKEALASLYYRYFKLLISYGRKISGDNGLVKDCIHDLFVEIWNNKLNLTVPISVKAYLLICIQRKLIRYKSRHRTALVEVSALPDIQLVDSKEDQLISDQNSVEQQEALRQAISNLTKRQREAIYLKFYANLSYREIVGVMNIRVDAIYNLISKAIDVLQKEIPNLGKGV
ncbi:MAG TPA: sigma-70 family RNA polymerase sigma factor [Chryseolinea sp.]|nr:sigma-70 family RNA polymerase sigma factor [Chryseolinea sp.]